MVTWMQVMAEARRLDEKQKLGERLSQEDAAGLVAMLSTFTIRPSKGSLSLRGPR
jgi:hypothetical protein